MFYVLEEIEDEKYILDIYLDYMWYSIYYILLEWIVIVMVIVVYFFR